jgi:basic membrane protein A
MKNVDAGLALALTRASDGTLVWGKADYIGISEGAVGLAKNTNYIDKTPKDIQLKIEDIQRKIVNNKIEIDSAF